MEKTWVVAEPVTEGIRAEFPELHPVVLQILFNRGVKTQEEIDVFLGPDWSRDVHDPHVFMRMGDAIARTYQSLEKGEMITVHGDYDADGVCGAVLLMSTLRDICRKLNFDEKQISVYLPHREKDGYGLNPKTIDHLKDHEKTKLVITVDCGISNKVAIDHAKDLGIDSIVCDHHAMPEELPDAILLHPQAPGETYPNKKLCGTGVAFKFATAMIGEAQNRGATFPEGFEKWLLDLVAIATVTDVMPILEENRTLEKFGLVVLNKTRRPGLKELIRIAGIKDKDVTTWNIGFQIGPRINAAGRIRHALDAYELLMSEDDLHARVLAEQLNMTNTERQGISNAVYAEAKGQVTDLVEKKILFAVGEEWPAGVVGLVAGKLTSEFMVPSFVITKQNGEFVGSGRSIFGFDVTAAMHKASDVLKKFGGHPEACGMSCVSQENLDQFIKIMNQEAEAYFSTNDASPRLNVDAELTLDQIDWDMLEKLNLLQPHGEKNPMPLFVSRGVRVADMSAVGSNGKHLRLTIKENIKYQKMIGFRFGEWVQRLSIGDKIDVVYEAGVNEWNGRKDIQLRLVDLKISS